MAGIESAFTTKSERDAVLSQYMPVLADSGKMDLVCAADQIIRLEEVPEVAQKMLDGKIRGRYVVTPEAQ